MAVFETWLDQDLKKPVRIQYLSGNLFSQDNMGNLIGVNVTDDGAPATLGGSVSANVIRADGATVAVDSGVLSGNRASVTLPQAAYAVPGVITVVIKITSGTNVTTLAAVVTTVYRSSTDTIVDPGTIIPSIQTLISQIETAVASIPSDYSSLWTTLAPAYSTSATYAVGQYVTYNGGLYRCTTAITSAESWTAAHWTAAKIGNDLSDLKSAIKLNVANADENNGYTSITFPGIINGSDKWTGTGDSTHCLIPVFPGDTVYLKRNGSLACVFAILTGNAKAVNGETPLFSSASGFTGRIVVSETDDITFTVPQDGQYLYLTNTSPNYTFLPTRISINGNDYTVGIRKFLTDKALKYIQVSQSTAETVYGKLAANLPGNSFAWVDGSWFTDAPSGTYWLFTIASKAEIENFALQFVFNPFDTKTWLRQRKYVNSAWAWGDWIENPKSADIFSYKGLAGNNSDLNDLTGFGIYGINSEYTIAHKPSWMNGGMLFVIPYSNSIIIQIATGVGNHFSQRAIVGETVYDWTEDLSTTQTALTNLTDKALKYIQVSQSTAETDYGKLAANLPGNSFAWVASSWFTDLPSGTWWVVTISSSSTGIARGQIAYAPTGVVWTRQKPAIGEFGEWALLSYTNGTPFNYGVLETGTDLNTITKNSIYGLNSKGNYTNKPTGLNSGYLFTVVYGSGFVTQFATKLNGSVTYTRFKNSSNVWSDWTDGNREPTAKYFAFGDSTTYGQIGGISPAQQSKYNYPACIGKALGMAMYNKAVGGQGLLKNWSDIQTNYITNLDMTGAKLITVGWAYNDTNSQSPVYYGNTPFGAYTDTVEAGDTPTTVIGYYYRIMADFQTKCPDAKLVLITGYGITDGQVNPVVKPTLVHQFDGKYTFADGQHTCKELYDTLEAMCNLHGWSCVNQSKGTVFNFCNASTLIGDQIHPNNDGYLLYGNFLAARVSSLYANISSSAF